MRGLAMRGLRGRPVDVVSLGARMRLYPHNNNAEKRLLFTPQYFDPRERAFLAERLKGDFVFLDVGASVGGYALAIAAIGGPRARILAVEPLPDLVRAARLQHRPERLRQRQGGLAAPSPTSTAR